MPPKDNKTPETPAVPAVPVISIDDLAAQIVALTGRVAESDAKSLRLLDRVSALEDRVKSVSTGQAERDIPLMAQEITIREPRSVTDVLKAEHAEIAADPEPHVVKRMSFGLTREQAEVAVNKRKTHLGRELGLAPSVRTVIKAAAAALVLCCCLLASAADYQGYPSTLGSLTNVPSLGLGGYPTVLTNGLGAAVVASNNIIPLRAKSGLSLSQAIAGTAAGQGGSVISYLYPTTDGTNYWTLPWATLTTPVTGTNINIAGTNWSELSLRGFLAFSCCVSNAGGTNVLFSGTVTNGQTTFVPGTNGFGVATNAAFINTLGVSWDRPNL